jgi:hypothetical protein
VIWPPVSETIARARMRTRGDESELGGEKNPQSRSIDDDTLNGIFVTHVRGLGIQDSEIRDGHIGAKILIERPQRHTYDLVRYPHLFDELKSDFAISKRIAQHDR